MKYIFETYHLNILDAENAGCKTILSPSTGAALQKERRKLYIVYHNNELLYVGEANTSIKTRFQRSCSSFNHYIIKGKARGGYKGYKWLHKIDNPQRSLNVAVATFSAEYDDKRDFIEAIEGELVYLIRNKHGYWPKFQNEIHFSNCAGAKEIAEGILDKIFNKKIV
ncbi:hypothetical protein [Flavobacterium sp. XGLA_31]|uniref:hypothetical protein n=1 Tax=Flavobacterium sp. XGLA_31 TaxID=3447666 RepID=UPI003F30E70A